MTVLVTRAVAATVANLVTRARRLLGDTETTSTLQRWSDTDIRQAIDDMLAQMYVEISNQDPSGYLQTYDMTYTAAAEAVAIPVAAGIEGNSIYKIEDVTNTSTPIYQAWCSPQDFHRFTDEFGWTLRGNSILLNPIPTAVKTLRIYTLAPYIPVSNAATPATDQHASSINHEALITTGAALILQEVDGEVSPGRPERVAWLWEQFQRSASRYIGPVYVRNTRILM